MEQKQTASPSKPQTDDLDGAEYLSSLLSRTLHIRISDRRLFVGQMRCTDKDRNIILGNCYEYREPSEASLSRAATGKARDGSQKIQAVMTSRFVGLVVIPGEHIIKIELEEEDASSAII